MSYNQMSTTEFIKRITVVLAAVLVVLLVGMLAFNFSHDCPTIRRVGAFGGAQLSHSWTALGACR